MRTGSKFLAATVALGAAMLASGAANANPIAFLYSIDGGAHYTQFGDITTNGINSAATTVGSFTIQARAFGSPALTAPDFQSTTLDLNSSAGGSLMVAVLQSGLTTPGLLGFQLGLTSNLGTSIPMTESFAIVDSAGVYTTLNSTLLQPSSTSTPFVPYVTTPNYTAIELYSANFGAAGGVVNANFSESGVFAVPEPVSISLLGVSLAGLGLIRLRRKS